MLADTDEELHTMADAIGVKRRWHQCPGTIRSHYDIALSKRKLAVEAGAIQISMLEVGRMMQARRESNWRGSAQRETRIEPNP